MYFLQVVYAYSKVCGYRSKHPSRIWVEFGFECDSKVSLLLRTDFRDPLIPIFL